MQAVADSRMKPGLNGNGNGNGHTKIEYVDPLLLKNDRELDQEWPLEPTDDPGEQAFIADIGQRGVLCPLMVSPDGRTVWDGRRRLRAAKRFAGELHQVPVIRCRDEDRQRVILGGLAHQRSLTTSSKVYRGLPWWGPISEARRSAMGRVENLRKPLQKSESRISDSGDRDGGFLSIEEVAEFMGIHKDEFKRCRDVVKLFEQHPDAKAVWEPKLLKGEASFWKILKAVRGELEGLKITDGKRPAEFRSPAYDQAFKAAKTLAVRINDFQDLTAAQRKAYRKELADSLTKGPCQRTADQVREVRELIWDDLGAVAEYLAEKAKEAGDE